MIPAEAQSAAKKAGELIRSARHVVVLTGAGISTPSGIPDFRSQNTGLWTKDDPMKVASLSAFRYRPEVFFNWLRPLAQKMWQASPNAAHIGLAEMEKAGAIQAVITQNIDGLHQESGSHNVLEVHGSARTASCKACRKTYQADQFRAAFLEGGIPQCPVCGAVLKPDIVLFEEMLPTDVWANAERHCSQADVMLVVGSALEVIPAAGLPSTAVEHGASLIINTMSSTYLDEKAIILLPYDVVEIVPLIKLAAIG